MLIGTYARTADGTESGHIFTFGADSDGTAVRIGDMETTLLEADGHWATNGGSFKLRALQPITVWATITVFGDVEAPCTATLNGEPISGAPVDGVFLDERHFTGVAGATLGWPNPNVAGVQVFSSGYNAGAVLHYERRSTGMMFMVLWAKGHRDITSPHGEVDIVNNAPTGCGCYAGFTNGDWKYDVTAAADFRLFVVEFPGV